MSFHTVDISTLSPEIFHCFQVQNALLSAGSGEALNTMTIGWGQLGTLWNLPVCTVYVRPERYTYGFMEENDHFTVSFLPPEQKEALRLCGTKSGRDMDKIAACGLTVCRGEGNAPYFAEAEWVLVCRKLFAQDLSAESALDERVTRCYGANAGGWHRAYTGEVLRALRKG